MCFGQHPPRESAVVWLAQPIPLYYYTHHKSGWMIMSVHNVMQLIQHFDNYWYQLCWLWVLLENLECGVYNYDLFCKQWPDDIVGASTTMVYYDVSTSIPLYHSITSAQACIESDWELVWELLRVHASAWTYLKISEKVTMTIKICPASPFDSSRHCQHCQQCW